MSDTPIFDPNAPFTVQEDKSIEFDPNAPFKLEEVNTSEGVVQEFAEGVASGLTKIPQGVFELGASAIDIVADTDYSPKVTQRFEDFREKYGIDPEGVAGTIGEVGAQFILPGLGAARFATSTLGKLAAAGAADAIVATDDTGSLTDVVVDWYDGEATSAQDDIGLQGQEEAKRRLLNKFKVGAEGAAGVIAAPLLVKGALKATAPIAAPILSPAARAVKAGSEKVGDYMRGLDQKIIDEKANVFEKAIGETLSSLRYRGILPQNIAETRSLVEGFIESEAKGAKQVIGRLQKKLDDAVSKGFKLTEEGTPLTKKDMLNSIDQYLTTDSFGKAQALGRLPKEIHDDLKVMRDQVDFLSNKIMDSDFIKKNDMIPVKDSEKTLKETIRDNLGQYLRRRYAIFEDVNYKPSDETFELAKAEFKGNKKQVEELLGREIEGPITDDIATEATNKFLAKYQNVRKKKGKFIGKVPLLKLSPGALLKKQNLTQTQKALLGEIKDPLENYVATVADLAEFSAVDNYFGKIRKLSQTNPGIAKLFRNTEGMNPNAIKDLENQGYTILGGSRGSSKADIGTPDDALTSGWGSLYGYAVPDRVYDDLTRNVIGDLGVIGNTGRSLYSGFLRAKGATQYGKTVLSPITQVRNVSTAALFAAMQGNVGRGSNLLESMRLVYDNILDRPDSLDHLKKLQRLGVVNSQAELKELQSLISKGFGYTDDATVEGLPTARKFGSKLTDNSVGKFVRNIGKKAEDLYQGGDDIWKIYNFEFEKNKLRNALGKMSSDQKASFLQRKTGSPFVDQKAIDNFLDDEAARIVRNTVPNYNLAPEIIKSLRKLPVGNFIAFPYEIVRTSINTVGRGIDELADANPAIQEIGLRRLTGALTTSVVLPTTLSKMGHQFSGVTEDEMEALQRSGVPDWEKNARLIPTGRNEDGTPKYINFSYSNPYDLLEKTVIAALNKTEEGKKLGKSGTQIAFEAGMESLNEFFAPFTEEAIVAAKVRDVLDPETKVPGLKFLSNVAGGRGGETITGAKVYRDTDDVGTKLAKSFTHILDAIIPSLVPLDVRGGEFQASRFARGLINSLDLNEELGISEKDSRGIERDLTEELSRAFSGITESEGTFDKTLKYKGFEFSSGRRSASGKFNTEARRPNTTTSDLLETFKEANEDRFRVYNKFYTVIEDFRTLGFKDSKIKKILKDAGVGDYKDLMRGRYNPLSFPSDSVLKDMRSNETINLLPRKEIQSYINEQRKRKFGESFTPDSPKFNFNQPFEVEDQSSIPTPANVNIASVSPNLAPSASNIAPTNIQPSVQSATVTPSVLNYNPKDIEIAQRLGKV